VAIKQEWNPSLKKPGCSQRPEGVTPKELEVRKDLGKCVTGRGNTEYKGFGVGQGCPVGEEMRKLGWQVQKGRERLEDEAGARL
jgi:hypothetical protein